jgi:hypothetical protein
MPYQNLPGSGKRIRPQPLKAIYARDDVVGRRPQAPRTRNTASYISRPVTTPSPRQTRQALFEKNMRTTAQPAKTRRLFKRPLVAALAIALIGFTVFHGFSKSHNVAQAIVSASPIADAKKLIDPSASAAAKAASAQEERMNTYQKTVNAIIAAHSDESIAVSTADVSSEAASSSITLGDQGTFTGASTAKLITAVTLLHQIEQGKLTINTRIKGQAAGTLLQDMIINSDNVAWQTLNDYLTHPTLKNYMAQLGFVEYDPDVNTFLPSDMTLLMKKFYNGQVLNKSNTDLLLSYMKQANKQE